MGFKNFLEKAKNIGLALAAGIPGAAPFVAMATAMIPGDKDDKLASAIITKTQSEVAQFLDLAGKVETFSEFAKAKGATVTGIDKLKMLSGGIADMVPNLEIMVGHEIVDQDALKLYIDTQAQAAVYLAKAIKPKR